MRPPCLAAGGVSYYGSAGSNLYPYLWIAGCPPLPLERRNQPLRRADQTAHPRVASRPRGNQPSIVLALIERAPPRQHGNQPDCASAPRLNPQTRQRRRKTAGNHPWPPKSIAGNRLPQNEEPTGPATAPPARASSPQGCQRTAPPGPRPSGDQPPTLDTSEYPLTRPCPAAPAGINRKRRALPQELEPPPSQEGISRGHSCQDRRP